MKVSGFTVVRNGLSFDYPFLESLRSFLPLVDQLVINVGSSEDGTISAVKKFTEEEGQGKVEIFESLWPLDDPVKKREGIILSEQTNLALDRCTGDWCVYLQADEVLHESDIPTIKKEMEESWTDQRIEALVLNYTHFYGSFDIVQESRSAYRREVRVIKLSADPRSIGDAQSFRTRDGRKLRARLSDARVFHYGWVRPPETMREKTVFMDKLYHGNEVEGGKALNEPFTGDNYRYKRILGLKRFNKTHPRVMAERIKKKNWSWDINRSPLVWRAKDIKKIVLDAFEKVFGIRLFEYRSYKLVKHMTSGQNISNISNDKMPRATLLLTTYNAPYHLQLVLAALERQTTEDFEVIICDDGSSAVTAAVIRNFSAKAKITVQHIWQEHLGFRKCKILNEGLRRARGEIVIFLDGDCVPHKNYIEDHLNNQERGFYLAGRRVELGPKITASLTALEVHSGIFDFPGLRFLWSFFSGDSEHLQRTIRVSLPIFRRLLGMNRVDDMKGCNYSVSKRILEEVNGFDEDYEGYGREDTDMELRLQNCGLKIKSLKGLALQFHVWHPRREFTPANDDRLEELKRSGRTVCRNGLNKL